MEIGEPAGLRSADTRPSNNDCRTAGLTGGNRWRRSARSDSETAGRVRGAERHGEANGVAESIESLEWLKAVYSELLNSNYSYKDFDSNKITATCYTDAKSLHDLLDKDVVVQIM